VEVLLHMIQVLLTDNFEKGIVKTPPPICSRVYQELSRGMVHLHNAKKITDTQFPYPYAQIIMMFLIFNAFLTPVIVASFISQPIWAGIMTFMAIFSMFSVSFIAVELEQPFGDDANDLPLHKFQEDFNSSLMMLIHEKADHMPNICEEAVQDNYDVLKHSLCKVDIYLHEEEAQESWMFTRVSRSWGQRSYPFSGDDSIDRTGSDQSWGQRSSWQRGSRQRGSIS